MRSRYPDLYAVADEIREGLKDTSSSTEKTKQSGLMQKKNTEKQSNG